MLASIREMGRARAGLRDRRESRCTFEAGPFPGRGADRTPQVLGGGGRGGFLILLLTTPPSFPIPQRARARVPGGGPPYFLCPFTCTRRMPVSRTQASSAALFSEFTRSHQSCGAQGQVGMADRPQRRPPHRGILEPRLPVRGEPRVSSAAYLALPLGLHGSPAGLRAAGNPPSSLLRLLLPHSGSFPTLHPPPVVLIGPEHVPASGAGGWAEAPLHVNLGWTLEHRCGPSRGYPMLCLGQELWASPFLKNVPGNLHPSLAPTVGPFATAGGPNGRPKLMRKAKARATGYIDGSRLQ